MSKKRYWVVMLVMLLAAVAAAAGIVTYSLSLDTSTSFPIDI